MLTIPAAMVALLQWQFHPVSSSHMQNVIAFYECSERHEHQCPIRCLSSQYFFVRSSADDIIKLIKCNVIQSIYSQLKANALLDRPLQ